MRIEELQRYGTSGWRWVQVEREWHTGRVRREEWRTNETGCGLWRERFTAYGSWDGWQQVVGTAQWCAPRSARGVRAAIHRRDVLGAL